MLSHVFEKTEENGGGVGDPRGGAGFYADHFLGLPRAWGFVLNCNSLRRTNTLLFYLNLTLIGKY